MSVGSNPSAAVVYLPYPADNSKEVLICHEKGWCASVLGQNGNDAVERTAVAHASTERPVC